MAVGFERIFVFSKPHCKAAFGPHTPYCSLGMLTRMLQSVRTFRGDCVWALVDSESCWWCARKSSSLFS